MACMATEANSLCVSVNVNVNSDRLGADYYESVGNHNDSCENSMTRV